MSNGRQANNLRKGRAAIHPVHGGGNAVMNAHDLDRQFRSSMRLVASTVTIVTAAHGGQRGGLTATAVCCLSVEPPLILACINRDSHTHGLIHRANRFCLNYLSDDHAEVARAFAHHVPDAEQKFGYGKWTESAQGNPVLGGCLATVECDVTRCMDEGTHSVFIGAVSAVSARAELAPLVYSRSGFFQLAGLPADA